MLLYIVRHAYAGEHGDPRYPDDSLRPLTKKGRKRFARLVKQLADADFAPMTIGTSPLVRCRQTAEIVASHVSGEPSVQVIEALAPGCRVADVLTWAQGTTVGDRAYVGHAPDVDEIAAALIGARGQSVHFAKGAVAAIEFAGELAAGDGILRWLVTPKLI